MDTPDVKAEIVRTEVWTGFIGDPPHPYAAIQLTLEGPGGRVLQPWLAISHPLAAALVEQLQTSLGTHPPSPPGTTVQ